MCKNKRIDGVYLIKNNITLNVRVGSAKDVYKRWSNYLSKLRNGTGNKLMQEDYNNNGEQSFEFIILEECNVKELFKREQYWLKQYSDCAMYNKNNVVNVNKKTRVGREAKNYKEKRSRITSGEKNGNNTKLSIEDVKQIKMLLEKGIKQIDLSAQYCVSPTLIWNIAHGNRWGSVQI